LSGYSDPGQARLLDEVRAKIFYLASDVEPTSQPAARLLRAVAESIVDSETHEQANGRTSIDSVAAIIRDANSFRAPRERTPVALARK
jgi:hypothetical protein